MIKLNINIYIFIFWHTYCTFELHSVPRNDAAIGVSYFSGDKTNFRNKERGGGRGEGRQNLPFHY